MCCVWVQKIKASPDERTGYIYLVDAMFKVDCDRFRGARASNGAPLTSIFVLDATPFNQSLQTLGPERPVPAKQQKHVSRDNENENKNYNRC